MIMSKKYSATLAAVLLLASPCGFAGDDLFTVERVGFSNNSDTLFMEVKESIGGTANTCGHKKRFRLPFEDKLADKALSIAMLSQVRQTKVRVGYVTDDCINDGLRIRHISTSNDVSQ